MPEKQNNQLADINKIRGVIGIPAKSDEKEKGIKGTDGFFWGFPDGFDRLPENWTVYYELENGQHHPDTNVLKYWPLLEERKEISIILIQWLQKKPRSKNRWELSKFVGNKMERELGKRFRYYFIEDEAEFEVTLKRVKTFLNKLLIN